METLNNVMSVSCEKQMQGNSLKTQNVEASCGRDPGKESSLSRLTSLEQH